MKTLRKWSILEIWENEFWMKLFTYIIAPHCTTGLQTMINDAAPDIARTPHTFIKRIGCPGQCVGCAIYAEEAVANAMMERLSNALHLKTATVSMSLSQTICINQLFYKQEKVDTSTKLFSEWTLFWRPLFPRDLFSGSKTCLIFATKILNLLVNIWLALKSKWLKKNTNSQIMFTGKNVLLLFFSSIFSPIFVGISSSSLVFIYLFLSCDAQAFPMFYALLYEKRGAPWK